MDNVEVRVTVGDEVALTSEQVAERIGVNRSRVRQLCIDGRFPGAVKMARTWFVPLSAVEAYEKHPDRRRKREEVE
jgi:hypothetical protein